MPIKYDMITVEDELIECADLWRRTPDNGISPYASDGPWHLLLRERAAGDYDDRDTDGDYRRLKPLPLTAEDVAHRDAVSQWLGYIDEVADRKLVLYVITQKARGCVQVDWHTVLRRLGQRRGVGGLSRRYDRALKHICTRLNGGVVPAA